MKIEITLKKKYIYYGLLVLGMIVSSFLYYETQIATEISSICEIGSKFSCEIVSQSPYAYLFGIPVSVWGFLWFLVTLLLKVYGVDKKAPKPYLAWIGFGFLFAFYLQLTEIFFIKYYCIFCITNFFIITTITILEYKEKLKF